MRFIYTLITLLQIFLSLSVHAQQAGSLDSTFNGTGKMTHNFGFQDNLTDVKVQPADQKIVIAGTAIGQTFGGKLLVSRLLTDGTFDTNFGDSGSVIIQDFTESYAYECQVRDDGKILVAGAAADPAYQFSMVVIRLNADGSIDSTFGTNGMVTPEISTGDDFAYAMVEQPDHKILLAGTALDSAFRNAPVVVRLHEDGSIDSTFGVNGRAWIPIIEIDNELTSILIQPDGKIVVSGHYDNGLTSGGQFDFDVLVARFDSTGIADATFGTAGVVLTAASVDNIDDAFGMQLTSSGKIVVSGFTTQPNYSYDALLLQFDSAGVLDVNFGNNGIVIFDNAVQDVSYDMDIQSDGKILIGGTSGGFFFDDRDFLIARYNADGSMDTTYGSNGFTLTTIYNSFDEANAMALQQDGKILLAGKGNNGNVNDAAVTRHINDISSGIADAVSATSFIVYPNPAITNSTITINATTEFSSHETINLFDLAGKKIVEMNVSKSSNLKNQLIIQLPSQLIPGFYFLTITGQNDHAGICKILVTGK